MLIKGSKDNNPYREKRSSARAFVECPQCHMRFCKASGTGAVLEIECQNCGKVYVSRIQNDAITSFLSRRRTDVEFFRYLLRRNSSPRQRMKYSRIQRGGRKHA